MEIEELKKLLGERKEAFAKARANLDEKIRAAAQAAREEDKIWIEAKGDGVAAATAGSAQAAQKVRLAEAERSEAQMDFNDAEKLYEETLTAVREARAKVDVEAESKKETESGKKTPEKAPKKRRFPWGWLIALVAIGIILATVLPLKCSCGGGAVVTPTATATPTGTPTPTTVAIPTPTPKPTIVPTPTPIPVCPSPTPTPVCPTPTPACILPTMIQMNHLLANVWYSGIPDDLMISRIVDVYPCSNPCWEFKSGAKLLLVNVREGTFAVAWRSEGGRQIGELKPLP